MEVDEDQLEIKMTSLQLSIIRPTPGFACKEMKPSLQQRNPSKGLLGELKCWKIHFRNVF